MVILVPLIIYSSMSLCYELLILIWRILNHSHRIMLQHTCQVVFVCTIWTQIWDPWDILSVIKRQKYKEQNRVPYCDVRVILYSCNTFIELDLCCFLLIWTGQKVNEGVFVSDPEYVSGEVRIVRFSCAGAAFPVIVQPPCFLPSFATVRPSTHGPASLSEPSPDAHSLFSSTSMIMLLLDDTYKFFSF